MILPREPLVFDLQVFDREIRKHYPEIASYDIQAPRLNGQSLRVHARLGDGSPKDIMISGLRLLNWGAYR